MVHLWLEGSLGIFLLIPFGLQFLIGILGPRYPAYYHHEGVCFVRFHVDRGVGIGIPIASCHASPYKNQIHYAR